MLRKDVLWKMFLFLAIGVLFGLICAIPGHSQTTQLIRGKQVELWLGTASVQGSTYLWEVKYQVKRPDGNLDWAGVGSCCSPWMGDGGWNVTSKGLVGRMLCVNVYTPREAVSGVYGIWYRFNNVNYSGAVILK